MAIIEVKVPELSESVSEGSLMQWNKKPGDAVAADEILIEIETDKVILEVPAPSAGVLTEIIVADGGTVTSGQIIAKIDTAAQGTATQAPAQAAPAQETSALAAPAPAATQPAPASTSKSDIAMPAAAKLLADNNLTTAQVSGSGKDGRVTKGDVLAAVASGVKPAAAPAAATGGVQPPLEDRQEIREPMSKLRARIAERLLESQRNTAGLTTFNEVNMAPVMEMRKKFQDQFVKTHGIKLGFMSFFVKAAVHALKKYPAVNASIDGNDLVYHNYYDIGIAVSSPRGLVVPVIRNADKLSFAQIEQQIAEFAVKAKEGKLTMAELSGGTFTISNGGTFGSMMSTPIINPPQAGILGVHATKERAVVENGQIVIRPMCYLALSYDHRIIDGRESVLSLVAIKEALEDPARMLVDL